MGRALLGAARMSNAPVEPPDPPQTLEDAPMTADYEDRSAPPDASTGNLVHFNPWRDFNDAAPTADVFGDEPDPEQITQFMEVVFGYCDGLIPVRSFIDKGQGIDGRPHNIWIEAEAGVAGKMATFATWASREGAAVYVIPGTVAAVGHAKAAEILQMQAVVVDIDSGDIAAKRAHLERHLGPPTMVVESGGVTAEGQRKAHVWWKLTEPAEGSDIARVTRLRGDIAAKVGGDMHFRSAHQPIRVAGSVYYKNNLKTQVRIVELNAGLERDVGEFIEAVADMPPAPGISQAPDFATPDKPRVDDVLVTPVREGGQSSSTARRWRSRRWWRLPARAAWRSGWPAWYRKAWSWGRLRVRARGMRSLLRPQAAQGARQEFRRRRRSAGVLALAEGAVGDALQEAGVVFEGADHGPAHLVGVAVEMVVAEGLQAGEHLVDLGLLADEGVQGRFLVAPGLLGAEFMARGCDRVEAGHRGGSVVGFLRCPASVFALSAMLINVNQAPESE